MAAPSTLRSSGDQIAAFAEQAKRIVEAFWQRQAKDGFSIVDPLAIGHAFLELTGRLMADPGKLVEAQARALAGQSRPLAERARPPARRARRTGRDRRTGRSPLCRPGLDRGADLRRRQAVLPALGRLAAPPGRRRRGPRAARSPQGRLLYPAVHQRDRAQQFSADQSRGAAQDEGDRGPQPDRGPAASAGRPGARQGPPADHAWPIRRRSRSAGTSPPRRAR